MVEKISTTEFQKFLSESQTTSEELEFIEKAECEGTSNEELLSLLSQVRDGKYTSDILYTFYSGRKTFSKEVAEELASVAEAHEERVLLENILNDERFTDMAHTIALDYVIGLENL